MDLLRILLATLIATSAMTAFSYAMSAAFNKLFKEPVLLMYIIQLLRVDLTAFGKKVAAWLIHYLIGLAFVIAYHFIWTRTEIALSLTSAVIFGAISGIIGIVGWMFLFRTPHRQPRIHFKDYYIQLFFAHVIFALGAWAVYEIV